MLISALVNGHSLSIDSDISALSGDDKSSLSQDTTIVREDAVNNGGVEIRAHERTASAHMPRYDKLHSHEIKDMLLIYLFVVKYVSEEHLVTWWQSFSETDVVSFFGMLEVSLHFFKYAGLRNVTVVRTPDAESAKPKPKKAHTLPARINPSEITHENTGTLVIHTNRENLIDSGKYVYDVISDGLT